MAAVERPRLSAAAAVVEHGLFFALLLLVLWVPIPLGSNRVWAWSLLEVASFLLLTTWCLLYLRGLVLAPDTVRAALPAYKLLAAWLLYQCLYLVPLPHDLVALIAPQVARIHEAASSALGAPSQPNWSVLTLDLQSTRAAVLKSAAYACIFVLATLLCNSRARTRKLLLAIVLMALVQSVLAVLLHLAGARTEWFGTNIDHAGSATGTYPNRDHFAGYLEMSLALGIGLLITEVRDHGKRSWREFFRSALELLFSAKLRLRLVLGIIVIALTTTHSRMGNGAFFFSLLVVGCLALICSRHAKRATVVLITSLLVIDLLIVGSWFGVERLVERIESTSVQELKTREDAAGLTLAASTDFWLTGVGPGAFREVFPSYRTAQIEHWYDYLHNDYVQFLFESGLLGFTLLAALVALSAIVAVRALWERHDPFSRGIAIGALMGIFSILVHSSVDFNLQIPANALLFMVLLALAWIAAFHDRYASRHMSPPGHSVHGDASDHTNPFGAKSA